VDKDLQEQLKKQLLTDKKRLEKELAVIMKEDLKPSQTEMSGENAYEDDEADAATTTFERERDDSLSWNIKDILNKINDALYKMEEGTYGICGECNQQIDPERLKVLPYADHCLKCQSEKEQAS